MKVKKARFPFYFILLPVFFIFFSYIFFHRFFDNFDDSDYDILKIQNDHISLVFSHNIHGETHPCGCRNFPLGGLPQVAGVHKMIKDKAKSHFLYVDTGDTFFASPTLPQNLEKSHLFQAENLGRGLEKLGLHYFIPGDQDFAAGWAFLQKMATERAFHFLISNLKDKKKIKHKSWSVLEKDLSRVFLLGFIDPRVLPEKYAQDFFPVEKALKEKIDFLKTKGFNSNSPHQRLIILSHAGLNFDKQLAKTFPEIDWIVGAHSQSFLRSPEKIGETHIVQALSRNHYVGEISLFLKKDHPHDSYSLHETHDEMKDKLNPNPFISFIDKHKQAMSKIQKQEQAFMVTDENNKKRRFPTAASCIECHEKEGSQWSKTPHALAYITLIKAHEENNLNCVQCHSWGLNHPQGFKNAKDMIVFENTQNEQEHEEKYEQYIKEVKKVIAPSQSIRELKPQEIKKFSSKWFDLEEKHSLSHNFGNVQCLNCHNQHIDHPFEPEGIKIPTKAEKYNFMKAKCLQCHDSDQSPHWYHKNAKGLAEKPNQAFINQKIKELACSHQ